MVLAKLLGLAPREPTRKELAAQMDEVRREIEKTTREISASAIEYARKSTPPSRTAETVPPSA